MASDTPKGVRISRKLKRTWAYQSATGSCQVLKYLSGANAESRKHMNALVLHVDERGYHPSSTRYRHIEGAIVELKVKRPKPIRVLAYRVPSGGHVLLLGFDKVDGPIPSETMKRARQMASALEKGGMQLD